MKGVRINFHGTVASLVLVSALSCYCWSSSQACLAEEKQALLKIKHSINHYSNCSGGRSWEGKNWVGENCCEWDGITCSDSTNRVVNIYMYYGRPHDCGRWYPNATWFAQLEELQGLYLANNRIGGWIMAEAFPSMKHLQILDLSYNEMNESFVCVWEKMTSLRELHLSSNEFHQIPLCLGEMRFLKSLNLAGNQLHGKIPSFLGNLNSLQHMDLNGNQLEGSIPSWLGNLHSLQDIDLSYNQLHGSIPSIFSNLTLVEYIDLSDNQLDGRISLAMFSNLSKLHSLDLSNNQHLEIEPIPPTWVPSFQLEVLRLSNCSMDKYKGRDLLYFLSRQSALQHVDISENLITGSIPSQLLYNPNILILYLRNNRLSGPLPQPQYNSTSVLRHLDISNNHIHGALPENIGSVFPYLLRLDMSENALQGTIPSSLVKIWSLGHLNLANNDFFGEIPELPPLTSLDLSKNNLHGAMLPRNFSVKYLEVLVLHGNHLSGTISPTVSNSSGLYHLDIGNNNLSGNIENSFHYLPNLEFLLLERNGFQGRIPNKLCQMSIRLLDLSRNHLFGTIPTCLGNLTLTPKIGLGGQASDFTRKGTSMGGPFLPLKGIDLSSSRPYDFTTKGMSMPYMGYPLYLMKGIDLSSNKLFGNIPPELGSLRELISLNLSNNLLTGPIPTSFRNMESLESLDLSRNELTGRIPLQMIELDSLAVLNVSFNDLSGKIPYERQFTTFTASSFIGNPSLCGQQVSQNCSVNIPSKSLDKNEKGKSELLQNDLFFYSCVAICYALGFWCFIGVLIVKKNWRRSYYRMMDQSFDFCVVKLQGFVHYVSNKFHNV